MNSFLSREEVFALGFASCGENVKISRHATFYRADLIEIGNNVRIDDFSVITGSLRIGNFCHIAAHSVFSGAIDSLIFIDDFCTFAYGVRIFSKSDDYQGNSMTGSVVPAYLTSAISLPIRIGAHSIIGTSSIVMPGVDVAEGTALGALSLLKSSTNSWSIYAGIPAKFIKIRSQNSLKLQKKVALIK